MILWFHLYHTQVSPSLFPFLSQHEFSLLIVQFNWQAQFWKFSSNKSNMSILLSGTLDVCLNFSFCVPCLLISLTFVFSSSVGIVFGIISSGYLPVHQFILSAVLNLLLNIHFWFQLLYFYILEVCSFALSIWISLSISRSPNICSNLSFIYVNSKYSYFGVYSC